MKWRFARIFTGVGVMTVCALGIASAQLTTTLPEDHGSPSEARGPRIQFAGTLYDFGKVSAGDPVQHAFVFTNIGASTLKISDVRPACGCTTAGTWDRIVEPGKSGVIPLKLNSSGFSGKIDKSALIECNDPNQPSVTLHLTGTVWKPIEVLPPTLVFQVSSESLTNETRIVRIKSNLDEALELSEPLCTNQAFQAKLNTVKPGKEFALDITALAPFTANMQMGIITLKTSNPTVPELHVNAYIMLQQPVTIAPNIIMLPPGPLTNAVQSMITVRNNGTNVLALSDVEVNAPSATVHVQEIQPGRVFAIAVRFPPGFQIEPEQKIELALKSNHPNYSMMKVPILHAQVRLQDSDSGLPTQIKTIPARVVQESPRQ